VNGVRLRGIDISAHQLSVPTFVTGSRWVSLRGTYGIGGDGAVDEHARSVRAKGLILPALYGFGVHLYSGRVVNGREQADALVRVAERLKVDRIALDWESDGHRPKMRESEAREFVARALNIFGDCGLYASASEFRDIGQTWDWVAKWGAAAPAWPGWEFWQYAARYGNRNIDVDYWRGTETELDAWSRRTPIKPPVPKPIPRPQEPTKEGDDVSFNIAPATTHRDARLKPGAVLFSDSALTRRQSRTEEGVDLGFAGSGSKFHAVVNAGHVVYVAREDVETTTIVNDRTFK
jgi:hypothetical protein